MPRLAVIVCPGEQVRIAASGHWELTVRQVLPGTREGDRVVSVFMRVDADDDVWLTPDRRCRHDGGVSFTFRCWMTEPGRADTTVTGHFEQGPMKSHPRPVWPLPIWEVVAPGGDPSHTGQHPSARQLGSSPSLSGAPRSSTNTTATRPRGRSSRPRGSRSARSSATS